MGITLDLIVISDSLNIPPVTALISYIRVSQ